MAVMQNSIIFGGVDSADYGIYIGGEGTFNAPKRDVEMISIPGRNGAFALDKGRFENIEVTYSAFNYETDLATFAQNLSDFRNAICSQKGYQRLTDTFHTDEYRMAAYISGLEIKPIDYNTASKFDIVFDCKPQRYLMSGESAIDVSSGDTILNPTLFEARPMLEVEGYGEIDINGDEITLNDVLIGDIPIGPAVNTGGKITYSTILDVSNLNNGDAISISEASCTINYKRNYDGYKNFSCSITATSNATGEVALGGSVRIIKMSGVSFSYGTPATKTGTVTFNQTCYRKSDDVQVSASQTEGYQIKYNGSDVIQFNIFIDSTMQPFFDYDQMGYNITASQTRANSTKSALGHPTYIDLDIGEAYLINNGSPVSLNNVATLPAELPTLKAGANEITFDNTVTDLKVVPRWWKV